MTEELLGTDVDEKCALEGCIGILEIVRHGDCSCHINPPCNVCLDATLQCSICGREIEND